MVERKGKGGIVEERVVEERPGRGCWKGGRGDEGTSAGPQAATTEFQTPLIG